MMIRLDDVHFSYRKGQPVLKGVRFQIGAGLTLLLGPNGSGKSTLLKIAAGIERPDLGSAVIEGHDLWNEEVTARRNLAYVSEQPDLTPYATIQDVIRLVCRLRSQSFERGRVALEKAGLWEISGRSIRELSSGQRRRAVMAAAWIGAPRVILLDEPLESMDRAMRREILDWLERLVNSGAAVVIAAHEIEPFASKAVRALAIADANCRIFESLPRGEADRLAFLQSLC
jgi:ABC-2 type transport system ATP-binding protein